MNTQPTAPTISPCALGAITRAGTDRAEGTELIARIIETQHPGIHWKIAPDLLRNRCRSFLESFGQTEGEL